MYNKVHIIDDDEISIFLTEAILDVMRFSREYVGYASANDALSELLLCLEHRYTDQLPDVIFLDLNMPFMGGWEFLDALMPYKEILRDRCLIYILTSSVDADEIDKAATYEVVTGFLQKPLEEQAIARICRPF